MQASQIQRIYSGKADCGLVKNIITSAFADDPLLNWIAVQDARRMQRIGRLISTTVEFFMPVGETYIESGCTGCALWVKPSAPALSLWQIVQLMIMLGRVAGWRRLSEMTEFYRQFESLAPRKPACHLFYLAVLPAARGQGIASALMQPVLQRCDAEGIPAYLENSNSRNLSLYERNGFEVTKKWQFTENAPPLWCMYREPG
jgi:GNAT superfamily N-acetyltransferase